jgi:putative transcriptional regulator
MNQRMRSRRTEMGLSQAELAKAIGVSRQTIVLIEQERFNPSLKLCLAICHTLETTLDDLFYKEKNHA